MGAPTPIPLTVSLATAVRMPIATCSEVSRVGVKRERYSHGVDICQTATTAPRIVPAVPKLSHLGQPAGEAVELLPLGCKSATAEDMMVQHRVRALLFASVALAVFTLPARAQISAEPIRIVFPFAAGGSGDVLTRVLAEHLRITFNLPVIVENRTGAQGRLGVLAVKAAAPDGKTLLLTPVAPMSITSTYTSTHTSHWPTIRSPTSRRSPRSPPSTLRSPSGRRRRLNRSRSWSTGSKPTRPAAATAFLPPAPASACLPPPIGNARRFCPMFRLSRRRVTISAAPAGTAQRHSYLEEWGESFNGTLRGPRT